MPGGTPAIKAKERTTGNQRTMEILMGAMGKVVIHSKATTKVAKAEGAILTSRAKEKVIMRRRVRARVNPKARDILPG